MTARVLLLLFCVLALPGLAAADRDVHAGLSMRTAIGAHQYRVELGGRWNCVETLIVLDPNSSRDGETDLDAVVMWWFRPRAWALLAGWRNTAFNLLGENRWHENLLLGINARLPALGPSWLRANVGLELVVDVVRHGSNVDTEWISFSSQRHFADLVHLALFARIEFATGY